MYTPIHRIKNLEENYIVLATSGVKNYHLDILNDLFLPTYSSYRFRYREKYVSHEIRELLDKDINGLNVKKGIIVLYHKDKSKNKKYCFLIREVIIKNIQRSAGFIYVEFKNLKFCNYDNTEELKKIHEQIISDFTQQNAAFMYSTRFSISDKVFSSDDEESKWKLIIDEISQIEDFKKDVFLKLGRIINSKSRKSIMVDSNKAVYKINGSTNYELEIIQSVGNNSNIKNIQSVEITPSSPESHIKFITKNVTILSNYDILKIQFRTRKRIRPMETILTLSPDREKLAKASTNPNIPKAIAESTIHLSVRTSRDVYWNIPLIFLGLVVAGIGLAISDPEFVLNHSTIIGPVVSGIGALLSASLGLRYLSEE